SFNRFLRAYLISAGIIFVFTFVSNIWIIPYTNKIKVNFENVYVKPQKVSNSTLATHMQIDSNTYVYIDNFDTRRNIGYKFSLEKFKGDILTEKLMAERITWDSIATKWKIEDYTVRLIDGLEEKMEKGTSRDTTLDMLPRYFDVYDYVFTAMD